MSVNKVQLANGETIIDISDSTVTPETLAEGVTAHDASGQKITGKMVPGGGSSVQSDWNQNDSSAADFIKNKPFGDELVEILPETEVVGEENEGVFGAMLDISLFSGTEETLVVTFDGVEYTLTATKISGYPLFGNAKYEGGEDTGEPFCIAVAVFYGMAVIYLDDAEQHTVEIKTFVAKKIDSKYVDNYGVFYVEDASSDNVYIYVDTSLTTKATQADLIAVAKKQIVRLEVTFMGIPAMVLMPLNVPIKETSNYGIRVIDTKDGTIKTYYTAEYTG